MGTCPEEGKKKKNKASSFSPVSFLKVQWVSFSFYLQPCRKLQKTYCQGLQEEHAELPLLAVHLPANSHSICSIPLAYGRLQETSSRLYGTSSWE